MPILKEISHFFPSQQLTMDPEYSLQDVVRCDICETSVPPYHCVMCSLNLCNDCKNHHISDLSEDSKEHHIVPFRSRRSVICCQKEHPSKVIKKSYCKQCNIPICEECDSKDHCNHEIIGFVEALESKRKSLRKDLQELEKSIYPKYCDITSSITNQKTKLDESSRKLITAISEHGNDFHREIDNVVNKLKDDVDEMNSKNLAVLNKLEDEITNITSGIEQNVDELNKMLNSLDVDPVFTYKSRNAEFRKLPQLSITLPIFTPQQIRTKQIYEQFGFLSTSPIKEEINRDTMYSPDAESSSKDRPFIDVPRIITHINTEYDFSKCLLNVSCQSDEEIWTCGFSDDILRLYNLQGELVRRIETKSCICDIAVTVTGDIIYTDYINDNTINIVKNYTQIQRVITLREWMPLYICNTSSGDFLVIMDSKHNNQSKVVRYFGSTEKQCIQYNKHGHPLFLCGVTKYITENRNLDICVADYTAHAVVVVNKAGELRFIYTGPPSIAKGLFKPVGITTDSQSRILIVDKHKNYIHILDQGGTFLCYIDTCHLVDPCGLCVDSRDNLFVAEAGTGTVIKIQYYK